MVFLVMATYQSLQADAARMKMTTSIPEEIATPEVVERRLGTPRPADKYDAPN